MPPTATSFWTSCVSARVGSLHRQQDRLSSPVRAQGRGRRPGRAVLFALALAMGCATAPARGGTPVPSVSVDSPSGPGGHFSTTARLSLSGTAASPHGIEEVWVQTASGEPLRAQWVQRGDGHTARWQVDGVFLQPGPNLLRIRAVDAQQKQALRYLAVYRAAPAAEPGAPHDPAAPALRETQGRALVEGDIDIGPAASIGRFGTSGVAGQGLGLATPAQLWPKVAGVAQIPYTVSSGNAQVAPALAEFNAVFASVVQWVPRSTQADFVDFQLNPDDHSGSAFSAVGRAVARRSALHVWPLE